MGTHIETKTMQFGAGDGRSERECALFLSEEFVGSRRRAQLELLKLNAKPLMEFSGPAENSLGPY